MSAAPNSRRVLVAEDARDSQMLLARRLERLGAHVSVADDGDEAIARAEEAAASGEPFHVILMDMQMPRINGYAAVAILRARGYAQKIIAVTGSDDRVACIRAGCDAHLEKPLSALDLISILEDDSRFASLVPANDREPARSPASDFESTVLLARFIDTLREEAVLLRAALAAKDLERVRKIAHRLKGTAGSFGFDAISAVADIVEDAAVEGSPHSFSRGSELVTMCERATPSLRE